MARLTRIVSGKALTNFREVTPSAGSGFSLLADAMNIAYERSLPAAMAEMERRGAEAGIDAAGNYHPTHIQPAEGDVLPGFKNMDLSGKIRDKPLSGAYVQRVSQVVSGLGPDIDVKVISGGQPPKGSGGKRTGSTRHDVDHTGHAHTSDFVLTRNGKEVRPGDDPALYERFIEKAAPFFPGIGHYAWGVHVGNGSEAFWGPDTTSATADARFASAFRRGRKNVAQSGGTNISTRGPTVPVRTSEGKMELRLFSQYSGPILQAYNKAALVAHQAEVLNKSSVDLLSISQSYPLNPEGFNQAAQTYINEIVKSAPAELRPGIRQALNQETTRRQMGMISERHRDIEARANNSSKALVERYSAELSDAIIAGDETGIVAAESKLDDILQAREALPGVAWTEEQSANVILGAQRRADTEIQRRQRAVNSQVKEDLQDVIRFAKKGLTSDLEGVLNDSEALSAHPELAREAQAFVRLRNDMPEILQMTPDQMDMVARDMRSAELSEPWQIDLIDAVESIAKENREAWDRDPVKRAQETQPLDAPPPELPDLSSGDPSAFTGALRARIEYMDEVFEQGYTDTRSYLSDEEAENMAVLMNRDTPAEIRGGVAAAIVAGAGPAATQVLDEIKGDDLTLFAGKMMAVGGNQTLATEMLRGQQMLDEGIVDIERSEFREQFNTGFSDAFRGVPGDIQAQRDTLEAARAIYASRSRGAKLDKAGQKDLVEESINAALGAGQDKRGRPTGGVQDVLGHRTLLPIGVNGDDAQRALTRAFGGLDPVSTGGIKAGIARTGVTTPVNEDAWRNASMQGVPLFGGQPVPPKLVRGDNLRVIAAGQNGYRMELTVGDLTYPLSDANGMAYFFDLQALVEGGE